MPADPRPACLVTGIVSPYRREPFRLLAEAEGVEVIAHAEAGPPVPGLTVHRTTEAGAVRLAASGRYRAVIAGIDGRLALPGAYAAARARRIPFVLWATIWAHPRTPAHALSYLPLRHIYRSADAVATYGPHVSRYVERHRGGGRGGGTPAGGAADGDLSARGGAAGGGRAGGTLAGEAATGDRPAGGGAAGGGPLAGVPTESGADVVVAPQAVDVDRFGAPVAEDERAAARERAGGPGAELVVLFAGRIVREKGIETLIDAWRRAQLGPGARLALAGTGPLERAVRDALPAARLLGHVDAQALPALYAAADVLVLPSIRTASFREPWGLVVNEAMLQRTAVVASGEVGAAAGGLVRDGRNGFVVPAGDADALATRLRALAGSAEMREQMGRAGRDDAAALTPAAWARGMAAALAAAGAARR